jgi:hypothetical protein
MPSFRAFVPLLMLAPAGCGFGRKQPTTGPTSAPALEERWTETAIAVPPQPARPVKEGPAPLVYLVEADTVVRVVDLTTDTELLNMPVMARQIVAVNPDLGVQVGGATMRRGSLPADHRYGIFLQSTTENVSRTGLVRPGRQP